MVVEVQFGRLARTAPFDDPGRRVALQQGVGGIHGLGGAHHPARADEHRNRNRRVVVRIDDAGGQRLLHAAGDP